MFIQTLLPPIAGDAFSFDVAGGTGATSIEVFIGNKRILARKYRKLPCRAVATIPHDAEGETLRIQAIDSAGHSKTLKYLISAADPGAHSMLSKTQ